MERVTQCIDVLVALAAKLEPGRNDSGIVNDVFEAAEDWKGLGRLVLEDKGYDIAGRLKQEVESLEGLRNFYGAELDQNPDFARVMELGAQMIAAAKQYEPPRDGYLGAVRIIRQTFAFLQTEFGLVPGQAHGMSWNYASDRVCVHLSLPNRISSWCQLKRPNDPSYGYELEDLLFMGGRSVSLALPPGQMIASEADVQAWFTTVADILRQYGSDVLADRPGAFERLAQAAAKRERRYVEECERLYGSGTGKGPGAA